MLARLPRRHGIALAAAAMLIIGVSVDANAVSGVRFSPGGAITSTETLRVRMAESIVVECPVTLSGSFVTSSVAITSSETAVGSITGLRGGSCARGALGTVLNLPSTLSLQLSREAVAGSQSLLLLRSNVVAIRVLPSGGGECLLPRLEALFTLEALGNNEYATGTGTLLTGICGFFYLGLVEPASLSPRQILTFLPGGEIIDGYTPNPVVFGTVRPGEL